MKSIFYSYNYSVIISGTCYIHTVKQCNMNFPEWHLTSDKIKQNLYQRILIIIVCSIKKVKNLLIQYQYSM